MKLTACRNSNSDRFWECLKSAIFFCRKKVSYSSPHKHLVPLIFEYFALIITKFSTQLPLVNTTRWFGRNITLFPDLRFRAPRSPPPPRNYWFIYKFSYDWELWYKYRLKFLENVYACVRCTFDIQRTLYNDIYCTLYNDIPSQVLVTCNQRR